MKQHDFCLPSNHIYLLNHSVGRMLKTAQHDLNTRFLMPWQTSDKEPWQTWLAGIEDFTSQLATLFNSRAQLFCPQTNLSSGLTKFLMSLPGLDTQPIKILMSEKDFPSMGFVMQHAHHNIQVDYIPASRSLTELSVWEDALTSQYDWVFISHVISNTGEQTPVSEIAKLAKARQCKVIVDVAQGSGILPIDLQAWQVDCVLGSCVKWLCGGPGAGFIWVSEQLLGECLPKDTGWFSHQLPFEFDIHHFQPHQSALRFWGGTPSIVPFVMASHSMAYFNQLGVTQVREYNLALLNIIHQRLPDFVVSPTHPDRCSGTAIIDSDKLGDKTVAYLAEQGIAVDKRSAGLRVSPHVYNTTDEINHFCDVIERLC